MNTRALGVSFIYKMYRVGDRTETCGTPACISLRVESSQSIENLNLCRAPTTNQQKS
jgi:hypothetical protein